MRALIVAAAVCGLLLVALGATAGHDLTPERQGQLNTILLFGFVHALAAIGTAALPGRGKAATASGWAFLAGVVLFSGGLAVRLLLGETSGIASPLIMIVPVGGVAFMLGWVLLATAALTKKRES